MKILNQYPLGELLWYQIGGCAKYLLECHTPEDIIEAIEFIKKNNIQKYLVVGIGANLLVSDKDFDGAVIKLYRDPDFRKIQQEGNILTVFAGELLEDVIQYCFQNGLIGLEWAGGLPSTVGGGVRGNVGVFGHEICESVESVDVYDIETSERKKLSTYDLNFSYRNSTIKQNKNLIILQTTFRLNVCTPEQMEEAKKVYHANNQYRKTNHPIEYPSCGSTFKNIRDKEQVDKVIEVFPDLSEKIHTRWHGKAACGALITKLGLSGYKRGNAQVSEKHANFIINLGGATFDDVYGIITKIQTTFMEKFGFTPETEVEIVK